MVVWRRERFERGEGGGELDLRLARRADRPWQAPAESTRDCSPPAVAGAQLADRRL